MDTLNSLWGALVAIWDVFVALVSWLYHALDTVTNAPHLLIGLAVVLVCVRLIKSASTVLTVIGVVIGAGALYTALLAIHGMPGRPALIVAAIVATIWLFSSANTPGNKLGKVLFLVGGGIVGVAALIAVTSYVPQLHYGGTANQIASSTASFWRQVADMSQSGITKLRKR